MDGEQEIQKAYEAILNNDFEDAISWFEKAVLSEPDNASYHYKLSITFARSGKLGKAIDHAVAAYELEPESEAYQYHLTTLKAKALIAEADKYLDQSREREQIQTAIGLLKQASALDPLSAEAYLKLAAAYAGADDYDLAVHAAKEAIRLEPLNKAAAGLLDEYRRKLRQYLKP
ncbi:hypothetical protein YDYSY3_49210 [Paenibacillus chitinolyticus]|uniref:tetratricopeptide repeat protein n=1 Tax=Paenibacillus chitinolyticus TaxID=79263 RepID=UPI0026E4F1DD|nr:tetratricopeptide repeat protein [Paenibacillus chitinolyticus]GKS13921.1 hypothetical protein YDYSY3_49210 [Paenibacillus chitinolyticus]